MNESILRYHNLDEYSKFPQISCSVIELQKKLSELKLISKKRTKVLAIATLFVNGKSDVRISDINLPPFLKIINKDKKVFKVMSDYFRLKIIMKIMLRINFLEFKK